MCIHMDDHLVHRGHAVFDTVHLVDGKLYLLERHLDRLCASAAKARSRPKMSFLRFWLGAGRGGFGISRAECGRASFYCLATSLPEGGPVHSPGSDHLRGRRVKTTPVPAKAAFFATLKSNNYLANALTVADAEADSFDYGIFVDEEGFYLEGPTMNVAILTQEGELLIPPFDRTLAGITASRLMELIPQHLESLYADTRGTLKAVAQRRFSKQDVFEAREAMLIGSTTYVTSIVRWDDMDKGEGSYGDTPGIAAMALRVLLKKDISPVTGAFENFTDVPYGFMTNMEG